MVWRGRGTGAIAVAEEAAHGGPGWVPRMTSTRDELADIWANCGVSAEWGTLRSVLLHRPGPEIEGIEDPRPALWIDILDPQRAREQHDALAETYRENGVAVHYVEGTPLDKPNMYFCRDLFVMTPEGAIVARPASRARAGEERYVAQRLAELGVPLLLTVHGNATFEGTDVVIVNPDLVLIGEGIRTNRQGAEEVKRVFERTGFPQVEIVQLSYGCGHIDGVLSVVDRDLAIVYPTQVPFRACELLAQHGFRLILVPDENEAQAGMAINLVPLAPRVVVMPAGNPVTRRALEQHGVTCFEVEISELMKGGGAVHCMTGGIKRELE